MVDISAGDVEYPPGGRLGPRWQPDLQLVLVHAGSARIVVDGAAPYRVGAGEVGLLLPGHREEFAFAGDRSTHHSWVQARLAEGPAAGVRARLAEGPLDRFARLPAILPASAALTELVRAAVDVSRTPLSTAEPLLRALAAAAFWRYAGEAESRVHEPAGPVERARAFLDAHLDDPSVDLARTADAAHVTKAHLVRSFKAALGITPMAYLWQRRVAAGIDLLTYTGLPVNDIARRSGFKSVYHFSRRVKARTGRPPTEVRGERWRGAA